MREQILARLATIEETYNVKIIYACEAGSRAWGLEHENSDYDVRFLYVYPLERYISIESNQDVIEINDIDSVEMTGWDIKKALQLMKKQNPTILEWIHSQHVYINKFFTKEALLDLQFRFLDNKPLLHHYFNMANTNHGLFEKKLSVKLLLNVVRPLLICQWLMKNHSFPPIDMLKLVNTLEHREVKDDIYKIINMKKAAIHDIGCVKSGLSNWIHSCFYEIKKYMDANKSKAKTSEYVLELNNYFFKIVMSEGEQDN
jgi:predicted nucleotidyltransferase